MISFSKKLKSYLLVSVIPFSLLLGTVVVLRLKSNSSNNNRNKAYHLSSNGYAGKKKRPAYNPIDDEAVLLTVQGDFLRDAGAYEASLKKYRQAIAMRNTIKNRQEDIEDGYILCNMGLNLVALDQLKEASLALNQALTIFNQLSPPPSRLLFTIYKEGLALISLKENQLDDALDYLNKALKLPYKPALHEIAEVYTLLGETYYRKQNLPMANQYYLDALVTYKKEDNINYIGIAHAYTQLGMIAKKRGNLDEAIHFFKRAVILDETLVTDQKEGANSHLPYLYLAQLYRQLNHYSLALFFAEKAFRRATKSKVAIDPTILPLQKELALFYYDANQFSQAAFFLEKYIALSKRNNSVTDNIYDLIMLGDTYMGLKSYLDASSCYKEAYSLVHTIKQEGRELAQKVKERIRIAKIYQNDTITPQRFTRSIHQNLFSMPYTGDNFFVILSSIAFFGCAIFALFFLADKNKRTNFNLALLGIAAWYLLGLIRVAMKRASGTINVHTHHIAFPETMISERNIVTKYFILFYNLVIVPFLFVFASHPSHTPIPFDNIKKIYFQKKEVRDSNHEVLPVFAVHLAILSQGKIKLISFSTFNIPYLKLASFINLIDLLGIEYYF